MLSRPRAQRALPFPLFPFFFFLSLFLLSPSLPAHAATPAPMPRMPYVDVTDGPDSTLRLSRLVMGTDHLGPLPNTRIVTLLDEAARLGINAFDTAPIYTDKIELQLGAWLTAQNRPDLHVITKGGFPRDLAPGTYSSRLKGSREQIAANVFREIDRSSLWFPRGIDIYLMHRDDADFLDYVQTDRPPTPALTILEALSTPVVRQRFRMLGLSNWSAPRVAEARDAARSHDGLVHPVLSSPYFSLLQMSDVTIHSGGAQVTHADMMDPDFLPGVKLMTYSSLGGFPIFSDGWEAAKKKALELKAGGDRYWGHVADALFHDANAERYQRACSFAERFNAEHGTTWTADQVASAWVLAHPRVDYMIIGPVTLDQLHRSVAALDLARQLTPADLDWLYEGR